MTAPLSLDDAMKQYGVVGEIVSSIPDLKDALAWAVQNQATQDALNAKIAATPWYKTHGQSLRNLILEQASDPAEYQQQLSNAADLVSQTAAGMGRQVDVWGMARQYLATGWTADDLKANIGLGAGVGNAQTGYSGDVAQYEGHLKQIAESYGVPYTQSTIDDFVNQIQTGRNTVDGFTSVMQARAKAAYPQYAQQLDAGQTMANVADPYMATMAKTLDIPQTQVTLNDPYIKKALSTVDPKTGAMTSQPLWQFEQTLKQDPRYGYTTQAKTDAYAMLHQVGKDFGFVS